MVTIDLRKIAAVLVLLIAAVFALQWPDIQRYLRIRNM